LICDRICSQESIDFRDERLFLRQIKDAFDEAPVPLLRWFVDRPADRENVDIYPLPLQLGHLPITERLAEGREPLKQVGDFGHGRRVDAGDCGCNFLEPARPRGGDGRPAWG
jgi:hypothetical protein